MPNGANFYIFETRSICKVYYTIYIFIQFFKEVSLKIHVASGISVKKPNISPGRKWSFQQIIIYVNISMCNNRLNMFRSFTFSFLLFMLVIDLLPWDSTCLCLMPIISTINTTKIKSFISHATNVCSQGPSTYINVRATMASLTSLFDEYVMNPNTCDHPAYHLYTTLSSKTFPCSMNDCNKLLSSSCHGRFPTLILLEEPT